MWKSLRDGSSSKFWSQAGARSELWLFGKYESLNLEKPLYFYCDVNRNISIFWALLKKLAIALIEPGSFSINIELKLRKKESLVREWASFYVLGPITSKNCKGQRPKFAISMYEVIGMHLLKGYGSLFP